MDPAITAVEYQNDGMVIDCIDSQLWVIFVLLEFENARHGIKVMRCLLILYHFEEENYFKIF